MTKITQIPRIEDGDSFSATNSYIGNKTVKSVFAIRRSESEPRYRKDMVLDFGGCTDEQLIQLALYGHLFPQTDDGDALALGEKALLG